MIFATYVLSRTESKTDIIIREHNNRGTHLYACMCRPACRIIHTGNRSTSSPRAARNNRGSGEPDGIVSASNNGNEAKNSKIENVISINITPFRDEI